jgi:hypothetical protein
VVTTPNAGGRLSRALVNYYNFEVNNFACLQNAVFDIVDILTLGSIVDGNFALKCWIKT